MIRKIFISPLILLAIVSCIHEKEESLPVESENLLQTKTVGESVGEHIPGSLLVYLDEAAVQRIEAEGIQDVTEEIFSDVSITGFGPALSHLPKNEALARELGLHRWFHVSFDNEIPVHRIASAIAARPEIRRIQFNSISRPAYDGRSIPFQPAVKADTKGTADIPFDDPMNSYQWNLHNTGDRNVAATAREGADVGVTDAWKLTAGSPDVIVAVCDAPVQYTHPDLAGAMWVNEAELNGTEGKDDDGNGYIDDIHGYNFSNKGAISWENGNETSHGTHVAGIIGAVNGNGIGVSSIAGGSGNGDGVRLMCCQIFDGRESGGDKDVAEALIYAADNGACIAQCSYGYGADTYFNDNAFATKAPLEYSALKYFTDPSNANHPSIGSNIAIYAAGNNGAANSDYPGALPICVSVTAFGPDFLPAGYTNYGRGCNIAAPGGDIWIGAADEKDNISQILSTAISSVSSSEYCWMQGSSMACPHVSGVAALGISYAGKLGKKFSGEEFKSLLLTSVNDMNQYLTGGTKPYGDLTFDLKQYQKKMGTGAIDAWKLLMQIEGVPSVTVKTGETSQVDLEGYFGESHADITYLEVDYEDAKEALGVTTKPKIKKGMLEITCTKNGSAKIRISAIAGGGQLGGGSNIGGSEISREISIISRGICSDNGGWL